VLLQGLAILRGEISEPVGHLVNQGLRVCLIGIFALGAGVYQDWVCSGANSLADQLSSVISGSQGGVYAGLDALNVQGNQISREFLDRGEELLPTGGYTDVLIGVLILISICLMLCFLGPLFIAMLLFQATAHLFNNWLAQLLNYVLLLALTSILAGLTLHIGTHYFAAVISQNSEGLSEVRQFAEILLLTGAVSIIAMQLPALAAGLAGGSTLSIGRGILGGAVGLALSASRLGLGQDGKKGPPGRNSLARGIDSATFSMRARHRDASPHRYNARPENRSVGETGSSS
jgi:type IV secretion system protein VirB6